MFIINERNKKEANSELKIIKEGKINNEKSAETSWWMTMSIRDEKETIKERTKKKEKAERQRRKRKENENRKKRLELKGDFGKRHIK